MPVQAPAGEGRMRGDGARLVPEDPEGFGQEGRAQVWPLPP